MYDLDSIVGFYGGGSGGGGSTWLLVSVAVALIGTIAAAVYLFGPQKRTRFNGLMLKIFSHVNFEHYIIPLILKFLYVFTALFMVVYGLITLFSSFITGLLMMVLGPIGLRVSYELIMMLFSIHDGIMETNRLLRGGAQPPRGAPQQYGGPAQQQGMYTEQPPQPDGRMRRGETPPDQPKQYPGGYDPMRR